MELKEFLYVDVDRVRSLLSQLAGGFIEEVRTRSASDMSGQAKAMVFGVGATGDYKRSSSHEEARSFQDLTFTAFESLANENMFITELSGDFADPSAWRSGEVHRAVEPGQLVSVECALQLLDSTFFRSRIERFIAMAEAYVDMNTPSGPPKSPAKAAPKSANAKSAHQMRSQSVTTIMGGYSPDMIRALSQMVESIAGDSVLLRILPCGADYLDYSFTGALLGRQEYLQAERENLFSRYGQSPTKWRTVFQVAAIPDRPSGPPAFNPGQALDVSGQFSRAKLEKMANGFLSFMEQLGLVEGPRWPSISVTPLGIYRSVPKAP